MSQLHIHANPGDVAPFVLLPGDPKRATFIAETFLESPRLYNDNRLLLGYSGTYRGIPVSVQTTGMGCPSLAIVVEELIRLGASTLVRVGTAGIISKRLKPGELVIATAAVPADGTTRHYLRGAPLSPHPDFNVVRALVDACADDGDGVHVGAIRTEDAFYATSPEDVRELEAQGVLAVEMEASALFLLGQMRRVATGCILAASNAIGDSSFVDPSILRNSVSRMVERALSAGVRLHGGAGTAAG
jgi:purine-nucleoside phosphorylase